MVLCMFIAGPVMHKHTYILLKMMRNAMHINISTAAMLQVYNIQQELNNSVNYYHKTVTHKITHTSVARSNTQELAVLKVYHSLSMLCDIE